MWLIELGDAPGRWALVEVGVGATVDKFIGLLIVLALAKKMRKVNRT